MWCIRYRNFKIYFKSPLPCKFIGFITNFKKSKRYVDFKNLKLLTNLNNGIINFVSVLVNPDIEILEKIKNLKFDYLQLYDVNPEKTKFIKEKYKKKIISALTIKDEKDIKNYIYYEDIADIILFDGKGYEKSIGFDHKLVNLVPRNIEKMIAGNLSIDNIPLLKNTDYFLDLSGALENEKGKKDLKKIDFFLNNMRKYET